MDKEFAYGLLDIVANLLSLALTIGIFILFGWLIYKAIIGIIREIKKK